MQYREENYATYMINEKGETLLLANFTARIKQETKLIDGLKTETRLLIGGTMPKGKQRSAPRPEDVTVDGAAAESPTTNEVETVELPDVEIDTGDFTNFNWVMPNWGSRCVIQPGNLVKDHLRSSIQYHSQPDSRSVYKHLGWTDLGGRRAFLHAGGAISEAGNNPRVSLYLPPEIERFDLTFDLKAVDVKACVRSTLDLVNLGNDEVRKVAWCLLAATFAPILGPCDFATHLTGRTGTFKSELASLFQSHFGTGMDARHLPGSWSSTANALEAQAFIAKNVPFVVDDFIPNGTSWQIRNYQQNADRIIRSQGNQSGRARLTDTSSLQQTMYPRGLIMSTGEDTPEGHSVRGRMMIMELSPGDIDTKQLTKAQQARPNYVVTAAEYIRGIVRAKLEWDPVEVDEIRNQYLEIGHTRTPTMLAQLIISVQTFIQWAEANKYITAREARKFEEESGQALLAIAERQQQYLETADPVEMFLASLRQLLGAGKAHLRSIQGGIPQNPTQVGWTEMDNGDDLPTYKSNGPTIGWVDWGKREVAIDITAGWNIIRKEAGGELSLTKQTLLKRLKDAGKLTRTDENRQRNTVRMTVGGNARQVIAMNISVLSDDQEERHAEE